MLKTREKSRPNRTKPDTIAMGAKLVLQLCSGTVIVPWGVAGLEGVGAGEVEMDMTWKVLRWEDWQVAMLPTKEVRFTPSVDHWPLAVL